MSLQCEDPANAFGSSRRRSLISLTVALGFSQGCGLSFYVASGGYFSALFDNPRFFLDACASFYLPPILVTSAQLMLDHRFDKWLGIKAVIRFRIMFSSIAMVLLLTWLGFLAGSPWSAGEGKQVLLLGATLGMFAAILLASSCLLFGAVDPRFVPCLILGQTFAGVYTNLWTNVLGFEPGCDAWRVRMFFCVAAGTMLLVTLAYQTCNTLELLDSTYQRHEVLLSLSQHQSAIADSASLSGGGPSIVPTIAGDYNVDRHRTDSVQCGCTFLGFPLLCWCMAICQASAVAMNMSLTPLSNQVAHGEYMLEQKLVLMKLFADFIGRSLFLLLPKPRLSPGWHVSNIRGQAVIIALIELLRLPLWLWVYFWATRAQFDSPLANPVVLLWAVWLPLISSGAFSASWCFVIAIAAATDDKRRATNLLMSCSLYAGFSVGIGIALLTA